MLDVPLNVGEFYLGDISVLANRQGEVLAVDGARLAELLAERLDEGALAGLRAAASNLPTRYVPLAGINVEGVQVAFDSANLRLSAVIDPRRSASRPLSLGGDPGKLPADTLYPASVSGAINLSLAQTWINESRLRPDTEGFEPITGAVDAYFNFGGLSGIYLFTQGIFDTAEGGGFQRGQTLLVKDLVDEGVRIAVGDVDPIGTLLQGTAALGGFQVATAYSQIQPNRNIRPSGRTQFILDRSSRVEVEVNGVVIRTLILTAGQYDLRDLSLAEGLNDVRLYIQDDAGRREVASFSAFFATSLLQQGINDYSIAAGFDRVATDGGFRYRTNRPQVTGFFRRGLTQNVTLGVNAQVARSLVNGGVEGVVATPFGLFVGQASVSRSQGESGFAHSLGYRLLGDIGGYSSELEALWEYRSREYRALNEFQLFNGEGHDASVRLRQQLPYGISSAIGIGYLQRRFGADSPRFSLSLGKGFGRWNANLLVDHFREAGGRDRTSLLASLSYRWGDRSTVRAQYRSRRDEKLLEYERSTRNAIGEWGLRAGILDSDDRRSIEAEAELFTNRGEFGVRTGRVDVPGSDSRQHLTQTRAAFGLAFADGHLALGRPVYDGFAIVAGHRTLGNRPVAVGGLGSGVRPLAKTDFLGPALVPLARAYQLQTVTVGVEDLPPGYDLGSARYPILPGARSGFLITVGSDASNTAIGVLLDADGNPVRLKPGELRSIEREGDAPVPMFTNRTGRFVSEKLKPGGYRLFVDGRDSGVVVSVPKDATGLVEVGTVKMEKRP